MSIYKVIPRGLYYNQRCENVLHFQTADSADVLSVIAQIRDVWLPTVRNSQNSNFNWFQIAAQLIHPTVGPLTIINFPNQAGTLFGAGNHPVLCNLFSLRTGLAGRHNRGRIYLAGVHGDWVDQGLVSAGGQGRNTQTAGLIFDRFCQGGASLGLCKLVIVDRTNPGDPKAVVQVVPRTVFGIQRRRNIGVGS